VNGLEQMLAILRQRRQTIWRGLGLEYGMPLRDVGAESTEHRRAFGDCPRQLVRMKQLVASGFPQRGATQALTNRFDGCAFLGRDFLTGDNALQIEMLDQTRDCLLGGGLDHQQTTAMVTQGAVERGEAFQQQAGTVDAECAATE